MCDLKRNFSIGELKGFVYVIYNFVGFVIYVKEKFNGFEYFLGLKFVVKYAEDFLGMRNNGIGQGSDVIFQVQLYGFKLLLIGGVFVVDSIVVYILVVFLVLFFLVDVNSEVALRLFIVCQFVLLLENVLKDVFSRFGNLIDVWMMKDRNFGYVKFVSKELVDVVIEGIYGYEVLGMKFKVMYVDLFKLEVFRKRLRI